MRRTWGRRRWWRMWGGGTLRLQGRKRAQMEDMRTPSSWSRRGRRRRRMRGRTTRG
jgi:hypothetical protein